MVNRYAIHDAPLPPDLVLGERLLEGLFPTVLRDVHEFPGATDYNLCVRHGSVGRVSQIVDLALDMKLLISVTNHRTSRGRLVGNPEAVRPDENITQEFRMLYLNGEYGKYIRRRDRVPENRSVGRHDSAKQQDHRAVRPHRAHTVGLDDVVTGLTLGGFHVRSGRRDLVNSRPLPHGVHWPYGRYLPQIVPDAVLRALVYLGEKFIEEVPEVWGRQIGTVVDDLLAPYLAGPEAPQHPVLLVCPGERLAEIVRETARETLIRHGMPFQVDAVAQGTYGFERLLDDGPDNLMSISAIYEFLLEYERSARNPAAIVRKIRSYVAHAKWGVRKRLAFVAETARAEAIAIEQARNLLEEFDVNMEIVISTYDRITRDLPAGNRDVWTSVGQPLVIV